MKNPQTKSNLNSLKKNSKSFGTYLEKLTKSSKKQESENFWNTKDVKRFVEKRINLVYDDWQWEYINTPGNTAARIGRQSGKSEAEAARLGIFCLEYKPPKPGLHLLITGGVERQAYELYMKMRRFIEAVAPSAIKGKPQEKMMKMKSGLTIRALPCGRDGAGLRNYAAAKIAIDEAHYVEDEVYIAVEPMLLTTMGTMDLMSTTRGNKGEFREAFREGSDYTTFHYKTLDVINARKICDSWTEEQKIFAIDFVEKRRKRYTKARFKQEFEAEFLDSLQQFIPIELYDSCICPPSSALGGQIFFGADFGAAGTDPCAYINLDYKDKNCIVTRIEEKDDEKKAWQIIKHMEKLLIQFNYARKGMGIDSTGIGSPILDYCLKHNKLKRKVVGLNSSKRIIDADGGKSKLLKNNMYWNLKLIMEQGLIKFPENESLRRSLLSVQVEINPDTQNEIFFGRYLHLTDALIRAAWGVKAKGLNIMAFC